MDWSFWNGELLKSPLALDTETTIEKDPIVNIPELVLGSASDGDKHYIIKREDLADFLCVNKNNEFVFHNVSFDYWVVDKWLSQELDKWEEKDEYERYQRSGEAIEVLWSHAEKSAIHDTMLLDQLLRIARGMGSDGKANTQPRALDKLAEEYCPTLPRPDKASPYRESFGNLLGCHFALVDPGYFDYAVLDSWATIEAYKKMIQEVEGLHKLHGTQGDLTESIQVKAAISLASLTRRGMSFDASYSFALEQELRESIQEDWDFLFSYDTELFKYDKKGTLILTKKGKVPSIRTDRLKKIIEDVCKVLKIEVIKSLGKKAGTSTSAKTWADYKSSHPFLNAWINVVKSKDLLKFFDAFHRTTTGRVHPRYMTIVRTGRTSSYGASDGYMNIQQMPRLGKFRKCFVASPGYKLMAVDYSFIELRTLAATCYKMFGHSTLGDVIKSGIDPHAYTASMINGISLEEFLSWKEDDPKKFKNDRQAAKAINFGVPGGLGPKKLVDYARANYGVTMSFDEARAFRTNLITEIYPELSEYLKSEPLTDLARNLGLGLDVIESCYNKHFSSKKSLYFLGQTVKGVLPEEYSVKDVMAAWKFIIELVKLSQRRDLDEEVLKYKGSLVLFKKLFGASAITITGRIRGLCNFTDSKNTPFQGLAADGIKLAMWKMVRENYRVVGMVHDELLIEIEKESDAEVLAQIMCEEMEKVLDHLVPVAVEYSVGEAWKK